MNYLNQPYFFLDFSSKNTVSAYKAVLINLFCQLNNSKIKKKLILLTRCSSLYITDSLIFDLQINTDSKMKSKRQDSLWSWGYKNINSRLFCLCFRGLSCRCCVCVRECLEKTASCQSKQRLGTLVSLYHCLVKVCLRGKGGHMCLSKWKRGW